MENSEDHPVVDIPPPLYPIAAIGAGYLFEKYLPWDIDFTGRSQAAAAALITALMVMGWALWAFRRQGTTVLPHRANSALIGDGPYRFSRNPIYLSFLLLQGAVGLALASVWPLLLLPVTWGFLHFRVILPEETYLKRIHGPAYSDYRSRVRRWL